MTILASLEPVTVGGLEEASQEKAMIITIDPANGNEFKAHAWGRNDKLVWWTEAYERKAGAENAIRLLQAEAASAQVIDRA